MHLSRRALAVVGSLVLVALAALVHEPSVDKALAQKGEPKANAPAAGSRPEGPAKGQPPVGTGKTSATILYGVGGLPPGVIEMRDAILMATRSGRLEDLKTAVELNEMKPSIGDAPSGDTIAQVKALSADGSGRDVLAAMANILEAGHVVLPIGKDIENNKVYVWPHFAETGVIGLDPAREVELLRLVPSSEAREMIAKGRYTFWRIGIGADGTWHFLRR